MNQRTALAALAALSLLCGGCAVYSVQRFGPEPQSITDLKDAGAFLKDVIEQHGAPDVIGGTDDLIVVGYTRTEGVHVLGLFGSAKRTTTGVLCDRTGRIIAAGTSEPGKALTILGYSTTPVHVIEDK